MGCARPIDPEPVGIESKEFLGGFIVLEVAGWDEAMAIASEWPSLVSEPNSTVSVQRVFERGAV